MPETSAKPEPHRDRELTRLPRCWCSIIPPNTSLWQASVEPLSQIAAPHVGSVLVRHWNRATTRLRLGRSAGDVDPPSDTRNVHPSSGFSVLIRSLRDASPGWLLFLGGIIHVAFNIVWCS